MFCLLRTSNNKWKVKGISYFYDLDILITSFLDKPAFEVYLLLIICYKQNICMNQRRCAEENAL